MLILNIQNLWYLFTQKNVKKLTAMRTAFAYISVPFIPANYAIVCYAAHKV
jgi:hypothetical protein